MMVSYDFGQVSGILICNKATGWSDNDVFTISGTAIGGTSPANDIEFGVNTMKLCKVMLMVNVVF